MITSSNVNTVSPAHPITRALAARAAAAAAAAAVLINLLVHAIGRAAGAELEVTQPGADGPMAIGPGNVLLMTVLPILLGGIILAVAIRWGGRAWNVLSWTGLFVGVLTIVMPFTVTATTATRVTLATMHLITGVAWFVALRHTSRRGR